MSSPPQQPPSNDTPAGHLIIPWREFFDVTTVSLPDSYSKTITRLKKNLHYFKVNYYTLGLMIIPILTHLHNLTVTSFIVSATLLSAFYCYFSARYAGIPIVVFGFIVEDVNMYQMLFIFTMLSGFVMPYGLYTLMLMLEYFVVVCLHACLNGARIDEDPYPGLLGSAAGGGAGGANYNTMQNP